MPWKETTAMSLRIDALYDSVDSWPLVAGVDETQFDSTLALHELVANVQSEAHASGGRTGCAASASGAPCLGWA